MHKRKGPRAGVKLISLIKIRKLLGRGYEGILCNVVKTEGTQFSPEDISVVREFPNIFSEEIPSMLPLRKVKFCIDLTPGATPISKARYRMVPTELKELKT